MISTGENTLWDIVFRETREESFMSNFYKDDPARILNPQEFWQG